MCFEELFLARDAGAQVAHSNAQAATEEARRYALKLQMQLVVCQEHFALLVDIASSNPPLPNPGLTDPSFRGFFLLILL